MSFLKLPGFQDFFHTILSDKKKIAKNRDIEKLILPNWLFIPEIKENKVVIEKGKQRQRNEYLHALLYNHLLLLRLGLKNGIVGANIRCKHEKRV